MSRVTYSFAARMPPAPLPSSISSEESSEKEKPRSSFSRVCSSNSFPGAIASGSISKYRDFLFSSSLYLCERRTFSASAVKRRDLIIEIRSVSLSSFSRAMAIAASYLDRLQTWMQGHTAQNHSLKLGMRLTFIGEDWAKLGESKTAALFDGLLCRRTRKSRETRKLSYAR